MSTYMPNFMNLAQLEIGILIKLSCFEGKSRVFMGGGKFFLGGEGDLGHFENIYG